MLRSIARTTDELTGDVMTNTRQAHASKVGHLFVLLAIGILATPAARADGPVLPLPDADRTKLDAMLGAGVVGEALPSQPITDPSVYFPLQERSPSYLVTGGPKAGASQALGVAKGQRPGGTPAWRFGLSPSQTAFLHRTDGGDLMMPAVTDTGEGVVVVTTPPNPFLLAGMNPGDTRTLTQQVSVNYLDEPSRQDYSGTLDATYTYVGTYKVTVPAGSFDAVLLRLKYAGKVGPAHTEDTAYYLFAPQVGVVAMVAQEDVEAFWVIHFDTSSGKVLSSN